MSWFNFFNKKTNEFSENNYEEFEELEVKEKLGVFVHVGDGNYVLLLAPYWDENLILDEIKIQKKLWQFLFQMD